MGLSVGAGFGNSRVDALAWIYLGAASHTGILCACAVARAVNLTKIRGAVVIVERVPIRLAFLWIS